MYYSPVKMQSDLETRQREKQRRTYVKQLRKMYHLSATNTASAQRILDKHNGELDFLMDKHSIHDVFWVGKIFRGQALVIASSTSCC